MKVVVTGVTKSGNLGGVAMLCAVEDVISDNVSDLVLASILPRQDMALSLANTSRIAPSDYRLWMLLLRRSASFGRLDAFNGFVIF